MDHIPSHTFKYSRGTLNGKNHFTTKIIGMKTEMLLFNPSMHFEERDF